MLEIPGRTFKKLEAVIRCVPRSSLASPILGTVCFKTLAHTTGELVIEGTNLEAYVRFYPGIDGQRVLFSVPRQVIATMLKVTRMKDVVRIHQDEQYVMFEVNDFRIACRPFDGAAFPAFEPFDRKNTTRVTFAPTPLLSSLSQREGQYMLSGIYVCQDGKKTYAVGADGFRLLAQLGIDKIGPDIGETPIMLLPKAFRVARVKGEVEVALGLGRSKLFQFMYDGVVYEGGIDTGLVDVVTLMQTFREQIIDAQVRTFVIEEPGKLIHALRMMRKLGKAYLHAGTETHTSSWNKKGFYFADDDAGVAGLYTGLKLPVALDELRLSPGFVMDLLVALGPAPARMYVKDSKSPICFTSGNLLGVVMPRYGERLFSTVKAKGNFDKSIPEILTSDQP